MRIALVQHNPTVGALRSNAAGIARFAEQATDAGARLIVFPELALTGYPPRDLLMQDGFLRDVREVALHLREDLPDGATIIVGAPWRPSDGQSTPWDFHHGARPTNSVLVYRDGHIIERYDKRLLPTYDVFDEHRYFQPGRRTSVVDVDGVRVGLAICEDLWRGVDVELDARYAGMPDPIEELVQRGVDLIVNASASPFAVNKRARQRDILSRHVRRFGIPLATTNQVGGNDDLIFDGHAGLHVPTPPDGMRADERFGSSLIAAGPGFEEALVLADLPMARGIGEAHPTETQDPLMSVDRAELLWKALVLGIRDYCRKSGFASVLLGLSGGIDSALVACLASAALTPERVLCVAMPSRYSSRGSVEDAASLARTLGVRLLEIPIESMHAAAEAALAPAFAAMRPGLDGGVAEENLQSRIRGTTLMALSNKSGAMLLSTGNKSELAVGYCTLYGDMNGGLAVLSDITKQDVYAIARWADAYPERAGLAPRGAALIPESTLTKPPSAELRPDQRDEDTLPPYAVLDEVIERYVERLQDPIEIVEQTGFEPEVVARIVRLIDLNEYKRKQMPIGLKVTGVAFGRGRRRAIAQGYRPDLALLRSAGAVSRRG
ncbi:MAG: NAD+ synthase [Phycisphaerales bacterium]